MKVFYGNKTYRGCSYDLRVCGKSVKQVSEMTDTSIYEIKKYWGVVNIEDDKIFDNVLVKAYGSKTVEALGLTKNDISKEITLEEFIERIDKVKDKEYEAFKKQYNITD